MPHIPVLLKEAIEILDPKPGEFFIDGTIGDAGHSAEILEKIGSEGKLLGIDWDKEAIGRLRNEKFQNSQNIFLVNDNYANLPEILKKKDLEKADGLILDLGFSSTLLETSNRGFSFRNSSGNEEPLDMRYNEETKLTAADVVNRFKEKDLAEIIFQYGEERFSRRIAKAIIEERKRKPIKTTSDLVEIIGRAVPKNYENHRIHPATRTFQALRIYVNQELKNLSKVLNNLDLILKTKGRLAVISFHSLEDRIAKQTFKELEKEGEIKILTKKPIRASEEEIKMNPRSRSAKLRAAILIK
ncbi:MAG: 16S rRNA (cytosine(1402)-N(4))-methyltransferase RsmH [Candidatus Paceibacterota bacterium]|jgi:16S rRNA (cytosine1402-N4)-methyltransferase